MLIRLMSHFVNNPGHIDKLICIKGLPEEWILKPSRFGGKELIAPWMIDIEENIPKDIRHLCDPIEVTMVFPPIEKGRDYVVDRRVAMGLRFEFMSEPGQVLWSKIERYLENTIPRNERVEEPVLVAPNHQSNFNPHRARRTVRGGLELEKCDIPVIDLTKYIIPSVMAPPVVVPPVIVPIQVKPIEPTKPEEIFKCDKCEKFFNKRQGLRMHTMKAHPLVPDKVGV